MSILIGYPDIPRNAVNIRADQAWADLRPHFNLYRGNRYAHGQLASATASDRVLRFTLADGATQSANYCILSRADLLIAQGVTNFALAHSSDDSTYTNCVNTAFASADLVGTRSQDVIFTFTETVARQYWRATISGANFATKFSKLYFGKFFDIDCYPSDFIFTLEKPQTNDFMADSGAVHTIQTGIAKYKMRIVWEGVTDAKAQELFSLLNNHWQGLFLYCPDQQQILNNHTLMHCKCVSFVKDDIEAFPDWNKITCEFEELVG